MGTRKNNSHCHAVTMRFPPTELRRCALLALLCCSDVVFGAKNAGGGSGGSSANPNAGKPQFVGYSYTLGFLVLAVVAAFLFTKDTFLFANSLYNSMHKDEKTKITYENVYGKLHKSIDRQTL